MLKFVGRGQPLFLALRMMMRRAKSDLNAKTNEQEEYIRRSSQRIIKGTSLLGAAAGSGYCCQQSKSGKWFQAELKRQPRRS